MVLFFAFSLEIYYIFLLKIFAYKKLEYAYGERFPMDDVISCKYFVGRNILNYSSPDYYNFIGEISEIKELLFGLVESIRSGSKIENDFDFIKIVYEELFPRELRHSMGEFYTPDWLADFTIKTILAEEQTPENKTYLDPTC